MENGWEIVLISWIFAGIIIIKIVIDKQREKNEKGKHREKK